MSYYIANIPRNICADKDPAIHPTSYSSDYTYDSILRKVHNMDISPRNISMVLNGRCWLYTKHVVIQAETEKEALQKVIDEKLCEKMNENSLNFVVSENPNNY
jgi:hypothetical protein